MLVSVQIDRPWGFSFASVDEHEPLGFQIELAVEPVVPLLQGVGPILLDGMGPSLWDRPLLFPGIGYDAGI